MSNNPLFSQNDDNLNANKQAEVSAAVRLIRSKVSRAFAAEPDAKQELAEAAHERVLSKHQKYMLELSGSGQSLAEIQTAWHHYYTMLPDEEKHEVWQEFYAANQHTPYQKLFQKQVPGTSRLAQPQAQSDSAEPPKDLPRPSATVVVAVPEHVLPTTAKPKRRPRTKVGRALDKPAIHEIKHRIANKVSAGGKLKAKHHLQALGFGLGIGAVVLFILLFSFFNQFIIAPFIQPSRSVSATPIIIGSSGSNIDASVNQIIIPKINVQIPLDFSVQSNNEADIETALENGVVHYPSTVKPGENGNAAFFGHSSNNIFNPGRYKFAFVLLRTLTTGDTFYITYNNQVYVYQVVEREIVPPSQVSVLNDNRGKTATAALITCDPPGTSTNRLVVWGEQISPVVASNSTAAPVVTQPDNQTTVQLASNGPTLWSRFINALEFWR